MNKRIAEIWINAAKKDLRFAKLQLSNPEFKEYLATNCNHAVEKAIKAYIFSTFEIDPDNINDKTISKYKVHDLEKLARYANFELSEKTWDFLTELYSFFIPTRYPSTKNNVLALLTPQLCERFITEAEEFISWIEKKLLQ